MTKSKNELNYTVDNILERVAQINQTEVWKHIKLLVRVEGKVTNTKNTDYNGFTYFDLEGTDAAMRIKCPVKYMPEENANIIFEGTIFFQVNKYKKGGITVVLNGKPVGQIEPIVKQSKPVIINKNQFIKLSDFFEKYNFDELYIIGSETGIRDVLSHINFEHDIKSKIITVASKDIILKELRAMKEHVSGFAIVRGGDDNETLSIWDEPEFVKEVVELNIPFFVAIGHSHRKLYIEQYADDSFATPTALGDAITTVITKENQLYNQDKKLAKLTKDNIRIDQKYRNESEEVRRLQKINKKLSNKINYVQRTENKASTKKRTYLYISWVIIAFLVLIIYVLM